MRTQPRGQPAQSRERPRFALCPSRRPSARRCGNSLARQPIRSGTRVRRQNKSGGRLSRPRRRLRLSGASVPVQAVGGKVRKDGDRGRALPCGRFGCDCAPESRSLAPSFSRRMLRARPRRGRTARGGPYGWSRRLPSHFGRLPDAAGSLFSRGGRRTRCRCVPPALRALFAARDSREAKGQLAVGDRARFNAAPGRAPVRTSHGFVPTPCLPRGIAQLRS